MDFSKESNKILSDNADTNSEQELADKANQIYGWALIKAEMYMSDRNENDLQEAESLFSKTLKINENNVGALCWLAYIKTEKDQKEAAQKYFNKAKHLFPNNESIEAFGRSINLT